MSAPAAYAQWCADRSIEPHPVAPETLARFVHDNSSVGIERMSQAVADIAREDMRRGNSNPAATIAVIGALQNIKAIAPPRSWPKDKWMMFAALPYDLQTYLVERDAEVTREMRRAQNRAVEAEKRNANAPAAAA
jgi:hypothetical protein